MTRTATLLTFCTVLQLTGCMTAEKASPGPGAATSEPVAADLATGTPPAAEVPLADQEPVDQAGDGADLAADTPADDDRDEAEELSPEVFEEGFCVDDIYAKYLTARYQGLHGKAAPKKAVAQSGKRSRRHKHQREERRLSDFAALAEAHRVMAGRTSPYFGAIPVVVNDRVDFWVQFFKTSGREQFMRWLVRGETLKRQVQPVLKDGGVPMEFFYLAMIESGLSNSASSRVRATGTWQFMRGTAQLYGLKINHWVDERRDPIKSTIAAANFLKDLYADLGDWHLAMAAYNAGPGKLHKAIRRHGGADFWALCETPDLAHETKDYVPKVLAAVLLAADPKAHGFEVQPDATDDLPETEVIVKRPAKLDELAAQLGLPLKLLKQWNPELIHDITPPSKAGYPLRLASYYANMFPSIEGKLSTIEVTDVLMYTVHKGDTLARIAKKYSVAVKQILALNPDLKANRMKLGMQIAVPVPGVVTSSHPQGKTSSL